MARNEVLSKSHVFNADETEVIGFKIAFSDSGNSITRNLTAYPTAMLAHAASHGFLQRLGDAAAGKQGAEAEEAVMGLLECLDAGDWYVKRERGEARPSMIAEAVWQFKQETNGVNEGETLESIVAKYSGKDGKAARDKAMTFPRVVEIVETKRAELAAARAKAAAEKAREAAAKGGATDSNTL